MINQNNKQTPSKSHHFVRTPLAALFGFIAVVFIMNAIITIWLNRTLTHTPTFVNTVAPLVEKPEIQQFIAKQAANTVVNSAEKNVADLSRQLLGPEKTTGKTPDQLQQLARQEVETRVLNAVSDPAFARSWRQTIEQSHEHIIGQLKSDSETITLDFTPLAQQAVAQLQRSDIGIAADQFKIEESKAKVELKKSEIGPVANMYDVLQSSMITSIVIAIVAAIATVILSVHHMKTLRRILVLTAVFSLILYIILSLPHFVETSNIDAIDKNAAVAITDAVFADLKTSLLVIAAVSFVAAIGSKLFQKFRNRKSA